jgi:hypothetical protein
MLKSRRFGIDAYRGFLSPEGSMIEVWGLNLLFRLLDIRKLTETGLTLNDFGEFWSRLILTGHQVFGALPPDRLLNVKFEEVQQQPLEKLRELIRFIDPSLEDPDWLEQAAAIPKPARSKFTTLPAADQKALTKACAPGLELLGYPQ